MEGSIRSHEVAEIALRLSLFEPFGPFCGLFAPSEAVHPGVFLVLSLPTWGSGPWFGFACRRAIVPQVPTDTGGTNRKVDSHQLRRFVPQPWGWQNEKVVLAVGDPGDLGEPCCSDRGLPDFDVEWKQDDPIAGERFCGSQVLLRPKRP